MYKNLYNILVCNLHTLNVSETLLSTAGNIYGQS